MSDANSIRLHWLFARNVWALSKISPYSTWDWNNMYSWSLHNSTVIVIHVVFSIIQSVIFPIKAPCAAFSIFSDLAPSHNRPTGLMLWITSQRGHLYFITFWKGIVKLTGDKSDWSFLTTGDISLPSPSGTHSHTHSWENVMRSRMKPCASSVSFSFSVLLLSLL